MPRSIDTYVVSCAADLAKLKGRSVLDGNLVIRNTQLRGLDALTGLLRIDGSLVVGTNPDLLSLRGLGSLATIGGTLRIADNRKLIDLNDLGSLADIGGNLEIVSNPALGRLDGLAQLRRVAGRLSLSHNPGIEHLDGLRQLAQVGGDVTVEGNQALRDISGMDATRVPSGVRVVIIRNAVLPRRSAMALIRRFEKAGWRGVPVIYSTPLEALCVKLVRHLEWRLAETGSANYSANGLTSFAPRVSALRKVADAMDGLGKALADIDRAATSLADPGRPGDDEFFRDERALGLRGKLKGRPTYAIPAVPISEYWIENDPDIIARERDKAGAMSSRTQERRRFAVPDLGMLKRLREVRPFDEMERLGVLAELLSWWEFRLATMWSNYHVSPLGQIATSSLPTTQPVRPTIDPSVAQFAIGIVDIETQTGQILPMREVWKTLSAISLEYPQPNAHGILRQYDDGQDDGHDDNPRRGQRLRARLKAAIEDYRRHADR